MEWKKTDLKTYESCYKKWGGSLITSPFIVQRLSRIVNINEEYFCLIHKAEIIGCVCVWDNWIAGSLKHLKKIRHNKFNDARRLFDLGYPEYIFPISPKVKIQLPFKCEYISNIHEEQITNLSLNEYKRCLAKSIKENRSGKTRNSMKRKIKQFLKIGGTVKQLADINPQIIQEAYIKLFYNKWGFFPNSKDSFSIILKEYERNVFGNILLLNQKIVALQITYSSYSRYYATFEYVNGSYDLNYHKYSLGSIIYYLNTMKAECLAKSKNLSYRYSFGIDDQEYKKEWCNLLPTYSSY